MSSEKLSPEAIHPPHIGSPESETADPSASLGMTNWRAVLTLAWVEGDGQNRFARRL